MAGVIDPLDPLKRRLERLELLVVEGLGDRMYLLSAEAKAELMDLIIINEPAIRRRAADRLHERLAIDPLPTHVHDDECTWALCPHRIRDRLTKES